MYNFDGLYQLGLPLNCLIYPPIELNVFEKVIFLNRLILQRIEFIYVVYVDRDVQIRNIGVIKAICKRILNFSLFIIL